MLPNQRRNGKENKKKTYYKIHSESDNRKKNTIIKKLCAINRVNQ